MQKISFGAAGFLGFFIAAIAAAPTPALSQAATFCPTTVVGVNGTPDQTGFNVVNGACTNGNTGAFSGAALASQALSDLSSTSTQETSRATTEAISGRRAEEAARCPAGFSRINGVCQRIAEVEPMPPSARRAAARAAPRRAAATPRAAKRVVVAAPAPAPAPLLPPEPLLRVGTWAHGFGDYEERKGFGSSNIACCTSPLAAGAAGLPTPLNITVNSRSTSAGFLAGIDLTARNVVTGGDGVIAGLLAGYISTDLRIRTGILSSNTMQVANGSSRVNVNLSGPSVGAFATYFNGPFSVDFTVKADLYDLDERFNEQLGFSANLFPGPGGGILRPPTTVLFSGRASTGLTNVSLLGNLNYRFVLSPTFWIEPTIGVRYTHSGYDSDAIALGLDDGEFVRVQGGARFGTDVAVSPTTRLTTTLTGLAYSDVIVTGGFLPGAGFQASEILAKSDEGKIRGQGILAFNLDFGNGVSSFIQGDVRGGENLFGAGGKAGFRVEW